MSREERARPTGLRSASGKALLADGKDVKVSPKADRGFLDTVKGKSRPLWRKIARVTCAVAGPGCFLLLLGASAADGNLRFILSVLVSPVSSPPVAFWLILPVVICLSQRLSHACLSSHPRTVKPRMAH